jgi:hypothetical protein
VRGSKYLLLRMWRENSKFLLLGINYSGQINYLNRSGTDWIIRTRLQIFCDLIYTVISSINLSCLKYSVTNIENLFNILSKVAAHSKNVKERTKRETEFFFWTRTPNQRKNLSFTRTSSLRASQGLDLSHLWEGRVW